MEDLKLSALGRLVTVGDLYNYCNDQIIPLGFQNMSSHGGQQVVGMLTDVFYKAVHSEVHILVDPDNTSKYFFLDINSHLQATILAELFQSEMWFKSYLKGNSHQLISNNSYELQDSKATISVHLKVSERHEALNQDKKTFLTHIQATHSHLLNSSTHLVTEVSYGFDAIFILEIPCQNQTEKAYYENQLFLRAQTAFSKFKKGLISHPFHPEDSQSITDSIFHLATWTFLTNLRSTEIVLNKTLFDCLESLDSLLRKGNKENFVPVNITLCSLASLPSGFQKVNDLGTDLLAKLSLVISTLQKTLANLKNVVKDPFLATVPHLRKRIEEFYECFQALNASVVNSIRVGVLKFRKSGNESEINSTFSMIWNVYFSDPFIQAWIIKRQNEIFELKSMLKNLNVEWTTQTNATEELNATQVFVFKTKLVEDPVIERLRENFNLQPSTKVWSTYEMFLSSPEDRKSLRQKLEAFCNLQSLTGRSYLMTSGVYSDGTVCSFYRSTQSHSLEKQVGHLSRLLEEHMSDIDTKDMESVSNFDDSIETDEKGAYKAIYLAPLSNRIALEFASRCQIKEGTPTIYRLRPDRKINRSGEFRWFDIGNPNEGTQHLHKVIVLLGATGCGKAYLIDGMINYILGVEWSDAFRFSLVSDGPSNQEKSQCNSKIPEVTAYTIHNLEEMKIPYSITIVDTPDYENTAGSAELNEKITRVISRFLSHPETNQRFDFVNAVCFVASSLDATLSRTHQDILDSVTSIFGKGIHDHLRLLFTFSDGVAPPILESIRQARIPGLLDMETSIIRHHKFNNSVLFVNNTCDNYETSFDEVSWKLDRINFQSFFEKLSGLSGRSLEETDGATNSRNCLETSDQRLNGFVKDFGTSAVKPKAVEVFRESPVRLSRSRLIKRSVSVEETSTPIQPSRSSFRTPRQDYPYQSIDVSPINKNDAPSAAVIASVSPSDSRSKSANQGTGRWSISSLLPNFFKNS